MRVIDNDRFDLCRAADHQISFSRMNRIQRNPGSTRFEDRQDSCISGETFTREETDEARATLKKSGEQPINLRLQLQIGVVVLFDTQGASVRPCLYSLFKVAVNILTRSEEHT